ncbi:MAG: hypothetical protein RMM17_05510 [Acidobacteriota bacterium]|nr:hypothetical protein [Blastocatellia bacterium]MDW8412122.1 hypothetical protein [Acidobacteriota bacterium]
MKLAIAFMVIQAGFLERQLQFERVRKAFQEKSAVVEASFTEAGLSYPPREVFIRVFKHEAVLELWARDKRSLPYKFVKKYEICASSGTLGPKRREGDLQVPEGVYHIDVFNPLSKYHLSMRVSYPNESDKILGYKPALGGDIYIHGDCVTIGCLPITDEGIKELYITAVMAKSNGQQVIAVHIFPTRLDEQGFKILNARSQFLEFWQNLRPLYEYFEKHRLLPSVKVDNRGNYFID